MDIFGAREDLKADLTPLEIPIYFGPLDKNILNLPAIIIVPPRPGSGFWVEPGESNGEDLYHLDIVFQCFADDSSEAMTKVVGFLTALDNIRSTWLVGYSVESPYAVTAGATTWYEIIVHAQDYREG